MPLVDAAVRGRGRGPVGRLRSRTESSPCRESCSRSGVLWCVVGARGQRSSMPRCRAGERVLGHRCGRRDRADCGSGVLCRQGSPRRDLRVGERTLRGPAGRRDRAVFDAGRPRPRGSPQCRECVECRGSSVADVVVVIEQTVGSACRAREGRSRRDLRVGERALHIPACARVGHPAVRRPEDGRESSKPGVRGEARVLHIGVGCSFQGT